jgi:type I restriction enzyme R subunit
VKALQDALSEEYGPQPHDLVEKITGSVDRPLDLIKAFKNDPRPKYVVTVDLLTTGIDVPAITNLVFVRRVNSRILYDQMIGRATRRYARSAKIFASSMQSLRKPSRRYRHAASGGDPTLTFVTLVGDLDAHPPMTIETSCATNRGGFGSKSTIDRRRGGQVLGSLVDYPTGEESASDGVLHFPSAPTLSANWMRSSQLAGVLWYISEHETSWSPLKMTTAAGQPRRLYCELRALFGPTDAEPALIAATQRPRELTGRLKELAILLDARGFRKQASAELTAAHATPTSRPVSASCAGRDRRSAGPLRGTRRKRCAAYCHALGRRQKQWHSYRSCAQGAAVGDRNPADPLLHTGVSRPSTVSSTTG